MDIKRYAFMRGAANHIPVSGTFELTPRCDFSCEMCYIHMSPAEQQTAGIELTTEQWLTLGRDAVGAGMIYLLLTGGEPMIRADFCELYTSLAKMGLMVSVNTNASLIDGKVADCFKAYLPEAVNITIYGMSDETYRAVCGVPDGYSRMREGVERLRRAGVPMVFNTTFTRHNADDMEAIIEFAKSQGVAVRTAGFIFPPVRCAKDSECGGILSPEEQGRLCARFDRLTLDDDDRARRVRIFDECRDAVSAAEGQGARGGCMAGRGAFWITWDGRMLPCGMLPGLSADLFCGGNDLDIRTGFAEAWERMRELSGRVTVPAECLECPRGRVCPVCGAVVESLRHEGVPPRRLCRFVSSMIDASL